MIQPSSEDDDPPSSPLSGPAGAAKTATTAAAPVTTAIDAHRLAGITEPCLPSMSRVTAPMTPAHLDRRSGRIPTDRQERHR